MREILFRGKDIAGNWHYGVPLVFTEDYVCMTAPHTYNKKVEAFTVSQYTGLTDKNGTKIFEGDIVKLWDEHYFELDSELDENEWKAIVVFGNPNGEYSWGFQLKPITDTKFNKQILLWVDMEEGGAYIEVIGNIYDNKLEDFENGC